MSTSIASEPDLWHCKQAAMLLHYTSLNYLENLHTLITAFTNGVVDPLLDLADSQARDALLVDRRWGDRNTLRYWKTSASPTLKSLQFSLAKDIAARSSGRFVRTAVIESLRAIAHLSTGWMSPGEEEIVEAAMQALAVAAGRLDDTLSADNDNRWNDFKFTSVFGEFAATTGRIPRFRVRPDVKHESGTAASHTGIYISCDDINDSVQFVVKGSLVRNAKTLNELGLDALDYTGRDELWRNFNKMFDFATSERFGSLFKDEVYVDGLPYPKSAPAAVASKAFIERSRSWQLLEVIEGEFYHITSTPLSRRDRLIKHRIDGGSACGIEGYYFAPKIFESRCWFSVGDIAPTCDPRYGSTTWHWDTNQT
jgi:hypothetical protein